MNSIRIFLTTLMCIPFMCFAQIEGIWMGKLNIPSNDQLRLVLSVEQDGDSLYAELDSPDQYASGIKVDILSFRNDTLRFKSNSSNASYIGIYDKSKDSFSGTFRQGKGKLPLNLNRTENRILINRPQTPQPPFPYDEEDVKLKFSDKKIGEFSIEGTLTYPVRKEDYNKKLLILVTGSGWQDRDESIMGHKPFAVIADYFTRRGYAVFRYDDFPRTKLANYSTHDLAIAAGYIVNYFKQFNEHFKDSQIGVMGHSEGGSIAVILAAENKNVDFIVSLAGMMTDAKTTLQYQNRILCETSNNFNESEVEESQRITGQLYDILKKAPNKQKAVEECRTYMTEYANTMTPEQQEKYNMTGENRFAILRTFGTTWFFELFKLDMTKYLKKVKCPVLAVNGKKDLQVEWTTNFALFSKYIKGHGQLTTHAYEDRNHLFQHCQTGLVNEYGKIEETFSEDVLKDIEAWLEEK